MLDERLQETERVARLALLVAVFGFSALSCSKKGDRTEPLTVFYAASLEGPMERWSRLFHARQGVQVRAESSGSQIAARKISEMGRCADLILVADYHIIDWLLAPDHAQWQILFAGNEIVLAHSQQSRHADELTTGTWRQILLRPDVRVGRADENLAPIGYQTLLVWMLADLEAGISSTDTQRSLAAQLRQRIPPSLVRPDIKTLASMLGLQVDYVFLYRSLAHEHNLKYLRLSARVNLSDLELAGSYARAAVTIEKSTRGAAAEKIAVRGGPVLYGLTIPTSAKQAALAERFVQLILGDEGQRVLEEAGFARLRPPRARGLAAMPKSLQPLVRAWDESSSN